LLDNNYVIVNPTNVQAGIDACTRFTRAQYTDVVHYHTYETTIGEFPAFRRLAILWVFDKPDGFGNRVEDATICSWDLKRGSTTWMWNGDSSYPAMSFGNYANDGQITCPISQIGMWPNMAGCRWSARVRRDFGLF